MFISFNVMEMAFLLVSESINLLFNQLVTLLFDWLLFCTVHFGPVIYTVAISIQHKMQASMLLSMDVQLS